MKEDQGRNEYSRFLDASSPPPWLIPSRNHSFIFRFALTSITPLTDLLRSGFDHTDTWGHRAAEPNKAVICSIALARLRTDIRGSDASDTAASNTAVGMAQKLLLFWRKPARRCWWEGVELEDVEGVEGVLKVWIRRVWTLEMVSETLEPGVGGEWEGDGA